MLARDPAEINLGQVIRKTEPNFRIVECFDLQGNTCRIVSVCKLRGVLADALESFYRVLDGYSLADVAGFGEGQQLSDFLRLSAISSTG
jgi:Rrf2 family nitric oxide-sensitive transcriptional repressor